VKFDDEAPSCHGLPPNRYISGRFLPDKAIDVIDEAGSRARLSQTVVPPDLREIEKRIEERDLKEKESSIQAQEFEKAAAFRDKEKELKKPAPGPQAELARAKSSETTAVVDQRLICRVIADITGIPVSEVEEEETNKLLRMEDELRQVGRRPGRGARPRCRRRSAATAPACAIPAADRLVHLPRAHRRRQDRGGPAPDRVPVRDQTALIRVDMSEYMEKHSVSVWSARLRATSATTRAAC
jgi:ATP-dependent Clp protease ATP-binding subunit ClpC